MEDPLEKAIIKELLYIVVELQKIKNYIINYSTIHAYFFGRVVLIAVGRNDGLKVGRFDGFADGTFLDGQALGNAVVGNAVGRMDGAVEWGAAVGDLLGDDFPVGGAEVVLVGE